MSLFLPQMKYGVPNDITIYDRWSGDVKYCRDKLTQEIEEEQLAAEKEQLGLEHSAAEYIPNHWNVEYFQRIAIALHRGFDIDFQDGQCFITTPGCNTKMQIINREGEFYLTDCGIAIKTLSRSIVLGWEGIEQLIGEIITDQKAFRFGDELAIHIITSKEVVSAAIKLQVLIEKVSNITISYTNSTFQDYEEERRRYGVILFGLVSPDNADGNTRQSAIALTKDRLNRAYREGTRYNACVQRLLLYKQLHA